MSTTQSTGMVSRASSGEIAASASAALAKATIEAKFTIAMHRPRNIMDARAGILDACKRPGFAERAMYRKPVGNQTIEGLNIRFAETALQAWKNVDITAVTAFEDEEKRMIRITVTDLESNISYSDEVLLAKTVERANPKPGQEVLGERLNTQNKKVFLVRATEDDLQNKLNAAKSKSIRNSGLRLLPEDILGEAKDAIYATLEKGGQDPAGATKKICDSFNEIGVSPKALESYLGHSLSTISPKELTELRVMFSTIRDGESSWAEYVNAKAETDGTAQQTGRKSAQPRFDAAEEAAEAKAGLAPNPPGETKAAVAEPKAPPAETKPAQSGTTEPEKAPFVPQVVDPPAPASTSRRRAPAPHDTRKEPATAEAKAPAPKTGGPNYLKGIGGLAAMATIDETLIVQLLHATQKADESLVSLEEIDKVTPSALVWVWENWAEVEKRIKEIIAANNK